MSPASLATTGRKVMSHPNVIHAPSISDINDCFDAKEPNLTLNNHPVTTCSSLQRVKVDKISSTHHPSLPLYATNTLAFPIDGLCLLSNFVSNEEANEIIASLDARRWVSSGINRKRRKQHFIGSEDGIHHWMDRSEGCMSSNNDNNSAFVLEWSWVVDRLMEYMSKDGKVRPKPNEILAEEYRGASPSTANIFETLNECCCSDRESCICYAAKLSLCSHSLHSFRKPTERSDDCWDLYPNKDTKILLPRNSVLIKTGECLFGWRSNLSCSRQHKQRNDGGSQGIELPDGMGNLIRDDSYRLISIKLRYINAATEDNGVGLAKAKINTAKYQDLLNNKEIPTSLKFRLSDFLTIVVTTSPIRSHPSTELLEKTFETFKLAGNEFARECKKIIVCDGFRLRTENETTRKHSTEKQALRNGIVNETQAERYRLFKLALRDLCAEAEDDQSSPFQNSQILELHERHGYGFALREAITHHVQTPFVCVIQHDRTFMRKVPLKEVVHTMLVYPETIKYVGMSMRSNLMYSDIFMGKYGKTAHEELLAMTVRPPELDLSADVYGKDGSSVLDMTFSSKTLERNIRNLQKTYFQSSQGMLYREWFTVHGKFARAQLSLRPTFFWYDNTHVAQTAHYRDFVFHPKFKMVAKGGFVEDKLSPAIIRSVERRGLREGHRRFGCYLLDDHSGMFFTGHMDGGSYMTEEQRVAYVQMNAKR